MQGMGRTVSAGTRVQLADITSQFAETSVEIRDALDEVQEAVELRIKTALDCYDELDGENQRKLDGIQGRLDGLSRAISTESKERTYVPQPQPLPLCICI